MGVPGLDAGGQNALPDHRVGRGRHRLSRDLANWWLLLPNDGETGKGAIHHLEKSHHGGTRRQAG